jgi:hypothetical protein
VRLEEDHAVSVVAENVLPDAVLARMADVDRRSAGVGDPIPVQLVVVGAVEEDSVVVAGEQVGLEPVVAGSEGRDP